MSRTAECSVCHELRVHYAHGACRPCYNKARYAVVKADPVKREKLRSYQRKYANFKYHSDPVWRARQIEANRRSALKRELREGDRTMDEVFDKLMAPYRAEWKHLG